LKSCAALALLVAAAVLPVAPAHGGTPRQRAAATVLGRRVFGRELLVGGDGEREVQGFAAGWWPAQSLHVETYGDVSGEWESDKGPADGGAHYLRLPVRDGAESTYVAQWADVRAESVAVDSERVHATLSAMLGGVLDGPGSMGVRARFDDGTGRTLGVLAIPPPAVMALPKPDVGIASLMPVEKRVTVPAGTRRIEVRLVAKNLQFDACPNCSAVGLADNVSLILSKGETAR
jgi:hypothetical protein